MSSVYCAGGNRRFCCTVVAGRVSNAPMGDKPKLAGQNEYDCYNGLNGYVVRDARLVLPYVISTHHVNVRKIPIAVFSVQALRR